jgi:hypothetical protein
LGSKTGLTILNKREEWIRPHQMVARCAMPEEDDDSWKLIQQVRQGSEGAAWKPVGRHADAPGRVVDPACTAFHRANPQCLGHRVVERRLAASLAEPEAIAPRLEAWLNPQRYAEGAHAFTLRHADFDPKQQLVGVFVRIDGFL